MDLDDFEYQAISLDTSVFDRNRLNLEGGLLRRLAQFKKSPVKIVLSEVVYQEVLQHLIQEARKAKEVIDKAAKESVKVFSRSQTSADQAASALLPDSPVEEYSKSRLDRFISDVGAVIVGPDLGGNSPEIFRRYFNCEPPFSQTGKKKSEFPDAFALFSIQAWAQENVRDMLVIAYDQDWKDFFKDSKDIEVIDDLAKALSIFQPKNIALQFREKLIRELPTKNPEGVCSLIERTINDYLDRLDPFPEAEAAYNFEADFLMSELDDFTFPSLSDPEDIRIIEVSDQTITFELEIMITFYVECEFTFLVHDSIDHDDVAVGSARPRIKKEVHSQILLTFSGDFANDFDGIEAEEAELVNFPKNFDFGFIEPDYEEPEDWA